MKSLKFRKATVADVVPLSGLIQRTIRVSNAKDYDQKSIDMLCAIFELEPLTELQTFGASCTSYPQCDCLARSMSRGS